MSVSLPVAQRESDPKAPGLTTGLCVHPRGLPFAMEMSSQHDHGGRGFLAWVRLRV